MSDEHRNDDKNSKKNGEFKFSLRGYILWTAMLAAVLALMFFRTSPPQGDALDQAQFLKLVHSNQIARGIITYDPQSLFLHKIRGKYYKTDSDGKRVVDSAGKPIELPFVCDGIRLTDKMEEEVFNLGVFETRQPNTMLVGLLYSVGPFLVLGLMVW